MEALAASCVVVASEYAGSSDLITHGVNGYVLRGSGSRRVCRSSRWCSCRPSRRAAVAARGREAVAPYDFELCYATAPPLACVQLARERLLGSVPESPGQPWLGEVIAAVPQALEQ